ncbi:hypothetical protein FNF29_06613 [Cafeteria roenbergensis]|uniref:FHA domain-containing protein n=1 Tax=Cafeteria roenbergensis TaxID=33653 RepID=A0A5A8C6Z8_CAFRO|nr:hypothetical protein FNF29_06613 [Cafeteria roenbergensis]|eukprot:KAA0148555.1 hypothetical protein FNF29_06613 [Cafeteria roenbergensis]
MWISVGSVKVGRSARDAQYVVVKADVSRLHAELSLEPSGTLRIADKSRTGTFVNGTRCPPDGTATVVPDGASVRLGAEATFTVRRVPLVLATSASLSTSARESIELAAKAMCIGLAPPGSEAAAADVLVCRAGRLSVRALTSIVRGLPVVLPSAVDAATALCNTRLDSAAAADHPLTSIAGAQRHAVTVGSTAVRLGSRRTLFGKDLFLFFDEPTHSGFASLLELAGAECRMLTSDPADIAEVADVIRNDVGHT